MGKARPGVDRTPSSGTIHCGSFAQRFWDCDQPTSRLGMASTEMATPLVKPGSAGMGGATIKFRRTQFNLWFYLLASPDCRDANLRLWAADLWIALAHPASHSGDPCFP
jgi:hypothetical protein